jgi:hypothetical protein
MSTPSSGNNGVSGCTWCIYMSTVCFNLTESERLRKPSITEASSLLKVILFPATLPYSMNRLEWRSSLPRVPHRSQHTVSPCICQLSEACVLHTKADLFLVRGETESFQFSVSPPPKIKNHPPRNKRRFYLIFSGTWPKRRSTVTHEIFTTTRDAIRRHMHHFNLF